MTVLLSIFALVVSSQLSYAQSRGEDARVCQLHKLPKYLKLEGLVHVFGGATTTNSEDGIRCRTSLVMNGCVRKNKYRLFDLWNNQGYGIDDPSFMVMCGLANNGDSHVSYAVNDNGEISNFRISIFINGPGFVPYIYEEDKAHMSGEWRKYYSQVCSQEQ